MSGLKKQFGLRLRYLRRRNDLTQEELAEAANISVDFLSNLERGINAPSFETIERIAKALDVSVTNLFEFKSDNKRENLMKTSFIGQPFDPFGWTADWLNERLNNENLNRLEIAAAWVKRSGLSRVQTSLEIFRKRGGFTSVIVGIDEGGATKEGLTLAYTLFEKAYVFHDRSSRTFHPKVYLFTGNTQAHILIGSSNVTAGGLFNNYEASLSCELDLTISEDKALLQQVRFWFDTLYSDSVCKVLDIDLFDLLVKDITYRIGDENKPRIKPQEEGYDNGLIGNLEKLFGTSSSSKKGMAPYQSENKRIYNPENDPEERTSAINHSKSNPLGSPEIPSEGLSKDYSSAQKPLRWFKKMSASDAQRPSNPNSNPTGSLKLTKAGLHIDQKTFFREEMFGFANWSSEERPGVEEAIIPFEVIFDSDTLGQFTLKIDHRESRIASQDNVPTWLHWGSLREKQGMCKVRPHPGRSGGHHAQRAPAPCAGEGWQWGTTGPNRDFAHALP